MNRLYVNKLSREFNLELCRVNRTVVGTIPKKNLNSITRSVVDIDKLDLSIDKYIYVNGIKTLNPLWYEMKEERLVCLNSSEYFVLKSNSFKSNKKNNRKINNREESKSFTAYSLEYKLGKIDVSLEDIAIQLMTSDIENDVYSLNDLLIQDTGWSLGHIDDTVLYDIAEDGTKTEKLRWQETVNKRWYDYIKNDICETFGSIAVYDTLNKKINLYDINTFGENVELYLSNDNYIKDLQREGSSEEIVTRLYLVGREEMDIIGETVTGYPYIEDYSYFIDNKEMSDELIAQLKKYYEMVAIREPIWKDLINQKLAKIEEMTKKKTELYRVYAEINAKKTIRDVYNANEDTVNEAIIIAEITKLIDQQVILEVQIKNLETDIANLTSSINEINILCKRETATDENGLLIFNEVTLNELKEFVYCDTYTNDSFLQAKDLIETGKRNISLVSYPTIEYNLDLENFVTNVRNNGFNQHWQGDLGLGDIVILYDEDLESEVYLYVNGYTQYPNASEDENELDIEISNKKIKDNSIRVIADRLKESELATKLLSRKVHLLNKQKYNRINIDEDIIKGAL